MSSPFEKRRKSMADNTLKINKDDKVKEFIKSVASIEEAMEPYKEQKRDLRKEYVDNGWLTKPEIKAAVKAYRLIKEDLDFDELERMYYRVKGGNP